MNFWRLFVGGLFFLALPAHAIDTVFDSRANAAGLVGSPETWGASWGDLNGDGFPDLFISNHRERPKLYQNNGDGTFTDVTDAADISGTWTSERHADTHGGSWSDFDGDGDQDLYVTAGRADRNQFFVNQGNGTLIDMTASLGPGVPNWRARMPVWFDYTDDGVLDFLMASENFVSLFEQIGGGFANQTGAANVQCEKSQAVFLADIAGSERLEIICTDGSFPKRAYNADTLPFTNVTGTLPNVGFSQDTAVADFNGDLKQDFFHVRAQKRVTQAAQIGPRKLQAHLVVTANGAKGFEFQADGVSTFDLVEWEAQAFNVRPTASIFIGSAGANPEGTTFALDAADTANHGIKPHGGNDTGIYVGYLPAQNRWRVEFETNAWSQFAFEVDSAAPMSNVSSFGLKNEDLPFRPALKMSNGANWVERAGAWGINQAVSCISAVAGDFDNDMDQDLYVVCRGGVENLANRLYENIGNARFQLINNAAGAAGVTGFGVGTGENVVTADYDVDGFLDLFVTNGLAMVPEGPGGPYELFRNRGNDNHWLLLDLVGVASNSQGVGAKVTVTAGGVPQLREQNGGYHRWSQNHQRLHFGLAGNSTADISIRWPSGAVDNYTDVAADKLYRATEGVSLVHAPAGGVPLPGIEINQSANATAVAEAGATDGISVVLATAPTADVLVTLSADAQLDLGSGAGGTQALTFTPSNWDVAQNLIVSAVDDALEEGPHSGTISFATASAQAEYNDLALADITVAITDNDQALDPCGEPVVNGATDRGLFVWQDCNAPGPGTRWEFYLSGGGGAWENTSGTITSNVALAATAAAPASNQGLEGPDTLSDATGSVEFSLFAGGPGVDRFAVEVPAGALSLCLEIAAQPADSGLFLGSTRVPVSAEIDLIGLSGCTLALTVTDTMVQESDGDAIVTVALTAPAPGPVSFDYATSDGTATAGADYTAASGSGQINEGESATTIAIPITDDSEIETLETFQLAILSAVNADVPANPAVVQIMDNDSTISPCGNPGLSGASGNGVYLWQDCGYAGSGQRWLVAAVAGGQAWQPYNGTVQGSAPLAATGLPPGTNQGLENTDVLDSVAGDNVIDFALFVGGAGIDAFEFILPAGATACFEGDSLPPGTGVFLGSDAAVFVQSFSIPALSSCNQSLTVNDASAGEGDGTVTVTITAAQAASAPLTVDFATVDGTATAPVDYAAQSGTATIDVGQTSTTVSIAIAEDADVEGAETLQLVLSNPVGTTLARTTAEITIADNDAFVSCGAPITDPETDHALFLWQSCDADGTGSQWVLMATGGGAPWDGFRGTLTGTDTLIATPFASGTGSGLEGSDNLDSAPGDAFVNFALNVGGSGVDAFTLDIPAGADVCFNSTGIPPGGALLLGPDRIPANPPFSLGTNGPCP